MSSQPQREQEEQGERPSAPAAPGEGARPGSSLLSLATRQELLHMPSPNQIGLVGIPGLHSHHHDHYQLMQSGTSPHHDDHNHVGHGEDGFMSPEDIRHLLGGVLGEDDDEEEDEDDGRDSNEGSHDSHHRLHQSLLEHHPPHINVHNSAAAGAAGISMAAASSSAAAAAAPPALLGDEADRGGSSGSCKVLLRTERKRSREKQRRSDVNKQFQVLTALLRRLETDDPDEFSHLPPYSPANRVELMDRTVRLLSTLYDRNKKRKADVADLTARLEASQRAGEESAAKLKEAMMAPQSVGGNRVMMMVPMLINAPTQGGHGGAAALASPAPASEGAGPQPVMPFQPWMSSFMGMPTEATPMAMMGHHPHPAMASPHHHHAAAAMPFYMPMTGPAPAPVGVPAAGTTAQSPQPPASSPPAAEAAPLGASPAASTSPSSSAGSTAGDLKQEAKVGSNLAHCA